MDITPSRTPGPTTDPAPPTPPPTPPASSPRTPTPASTPTPTNTPAPAPASSAHSARPIPAIQVTDVHKSYGSTHAVDGISLDIPQGQILALLGQNGAGKTTLIDLVLGLQHPDEGTAEIFGMPPREAIRRSLVGVVHQTGALLPDYTVLQTLKLFGGTHAHHLPINQILAETDLESLAKRKVGKLSGGEQQRVRLALALLPDPLLLILDEPTAGMDALARRRFWELMRAQADAGRSIVFATHYLAEAQDFAERTVIVKTGRIITDGTTDEVRRLDLTRTLTIALDTTGSPSEDEAARSTLESALRALPGSEDWLIEWPPGELSIQGADLDEAARIILAHPGAHGLEITTSSLEDVFTSLTA